MSSAPKAPRKRPVAPKPPTARALIDRELTRDWKAALARFEAAQTTEAGFWDASYEALGEILLHDPPLYLAGGFRTARAFLAKHLPGVSESTVREGVRVARHFDPAQEKKHGVAKLALLLDYLEARSPLPDAGIDPDRTRVEVGDGDARKKVAFTTLSFDELRAAARSARTSSRRARPTDPPAVGAMRKALKTARLSAVGLRLRTGAVMDFSGVPIKRLDAFVRALRGFKLPKP